jgi:hypothetical protein
MASKKKKTKKSLLVAFIPMRVPPMRATKQPITTISWEIVPEVQVEDIPKTVEGSILESKIDQKPPRREEVILLTFRLVGKTVEEPIPEGERNPTPPREVVEDNAEDSQQLTIPRRMKTCVRKLKGAETGMVGEVSKSSRIEALNKHVRTCLSQVKSLFGRPEYEHPEEPVATQDATTRASAKATSPANTEEMIIDSFEGDGEDLKDARQRHQTDLPPPSRVRSLVPSPSQSEGLQSPSPSINQPKPTSAENR